VENKSPADEVISSEESDWDYDDLSVFSSSEDEKDDVTAESLHQLDQKHDSAVQVDCGSVKMMDAAVQMNAVVKTDSGVQVDDAELKRVRK